MARDSLAAARLWSLQCTLRDPVVHKNTAWFRMNLGTVLPIVKKSTQRVERSRPNEKKRVLVEDVARPKVVGIERLAAGESLVLTMVKTNAVFAEPPAEINLFIVDQRREIQQAHFKIFDEATGFEDAVERGLKRFGQVLVLDSQGGKLFVGDNHAAHHGNPGGNRGEIRFQSGKLLPAIHGFHEERLQLLTCAFRFGESEKALLRFRLGVLVLVLVVFVCHGALDGLRRRGEGSTVVRPIS